MHGLRTHYLAEVPLVSLLIYSLYGSVDVENKKDSLDRQTDKQTDRQTDRQIVIFELLS